MSEILKAVQFIKSNKLVAFPTETVYGLGADATNEIACQKIFQIKSRPNINPLVIHVVNIEQAYEIGIFNDDAKELAKAFWPGPLSIVVPIKKNITIAKIVYANLDSIAIRIPLHPIATKLIHTANVPIAAPSANPSGYISATSFEHVKKHFSDIKEIYILKDCFIKSTYGIESTIIDATSNNLTILREGCITIKMLQQRLKKNFYTSSTICKIKAPGMMEKHYAPQVQLRINANNIKHGEIGLNFYNSKLNSNFSCNLSISGNLNEAARNLYSNLRILEEYALKHKIHTIAVAKIPNVDIGVAINDKLRRASIK